MFKSFNTINSVKVDAHSFRVTLNILQHSECCPDDLADVIARLEKGGWNRHNLPADDAEVIYSDVDNDLVVEALKEWDVETARMRDWGYPMWQGFAPDWWDGHSHSTDCRLCGHRDNRYEFPLVNRKNGREIWTGSTCIVKYGVTVDGDGVAETALKKLRECMGVSKKAQTRDEWQAAHPNHADDMATIEKALPIANRKYLPWEIRRAVDEDGNRILPANFESQRNALGKWGRAATKYYRKNGYLTQQRTDDLYHDAGDNQFVEGQMLARARSIVALWDKATEHDPREMKKRAARNFWSQFKAENPVMNDYQRGRVEYWEGRGYMLDDLYSRNRELVEEIRKANSATGQTAARANDRANAKKRAKLPWSR